jgi:hypothetical protein
MPYVSAAIFLVMTLVISVGYQGGESDPAIR